MITYFYKILYNNKDVVYVGVTTRKINKRFQEHIKSKRLDNRYTCVEFDKIIHPKIDSIETFYKEYTKVANLERKYIKEEKDKGSALLNITKGGEWGTEILSKLRKKNFLEKFGSYDGYREFILNKKRLRGWLRSWISKETINKTKLWLYSWSTSKKVNRTKIWLYSWSTSKKVNRTKIWLRYWIKSRSMNETKRWLYNWIFNTTNSITKKWLLHWIKSKSMNETKRWLHRWIKKASVNRTKTWLHHWISHRKECRTKTWLHHWISHRSECRTRTWLMHWIYNKEYRKRKLLINANG